MFFQTLAEALQKGYGLHVTTRLGVRHAELMGPEEAGIKLLPNICGEGRTLEEALAILQENYLRIMTGAETLRTASFISGWPTATSPLDAWVNTPSRKLYWRFRNGGFECSLWRDNVPAKPSNIHPTLELAADEALQNSSG